MSVIPAPRLLDEHQIAACANARQALSLCIRLSGYTDEVVAERLGISKGHLSKILNGRASLSADLRIKLMNVCGNLAPMQYEVRAMGHELDLNAAEVELLRRRLGERQSAGRMAAA